MGRGRYTSVERFCELLDSDFPSYHGQRTPVHPSISHFLKDRTNSRRSEKYSGPYNSYSFELELWGLKQAVRHKPRIVFFPYADYDYFYWQYFKKVLGSKVVLWSFFSETELQERFKDLSHFEKADLVLVAGKSQLAYIKEKASKANAHYFPIGVDTDFFTPGSEYDPMRLVHVGNNRRDFQTLIAAMDMVYQEYPQLKLELIGASSSRNEIPERPYLKIYNQLDDEAYLKILQSSNFAILSLEDGGSSNSLLETSACGLPLIATRLPNISDYYDDEFCRYFERGDSVVLAALCIDLMLSAEKRKHMAVAARTHSKKYDWFKINIKFQEFLAQ